MHYWNGGGTKKPECGQTQKSQTSYAPIFGLSNLANLGIVCPVFYKLLGYKIS